MKYLFANPSERIYPDIVIDGVVLVAQPGEIREFKEPPSDGLWAPYAPAAPARDDKAAKPAKES